MIDNNTIYVHLGRDKFDFDKFEKVKNNINFPYKPAIGGYWASSEDFKYSWENTFKLEDIQKLCISKFKLKESTKILEITEESDLVNLPHLPDKDDIKEALDYEKISDLYDVIYYNPLNKELIDELLPKWDCECIYIMKSDVIIELND